jgi:hypothetical protein
MKAIEMFKDLQEDHFVCSICGNFLFEIEPISREQVRLTCENCGQCHLIGAGSEDKNRFLVEFSTENKNKLDITLT